MNASPSQSLFEEQRVVGASAALLLLLSILSGFYVAAAMTGQLPVNARMALGAHLTGLLGAMVLFAYAWSLPLLRFARSGRMRIAVALVVGNFGNLIIGSLKAIPGVHGVAATGELTNDVVFGLLTVLVVLPLMLGVGGWVYGFGGRPPSQEQRVVGVENVGIVPLQTVGSGQILGRMRAPR